MKDYKGSLINDATCPFFIIDSNFRSVQSQITCEGLYGQSNKIIFEKHTDKLKHGLTYCTKDYKECLLYKALMTKYEVDKDESRRN